MKFRICFIIIIYISTISTSYIHAIQKQEDTYRLYNKANKLISEQPDSALIMLKSILDNAQDIDDSLLLNTYYHLGKLSTQLQNFSEAFDYFEQALHTSEVVKDFIMKARCAQELGNLYTQFGKEAISHNFHILSLNLNKLLYKNAIVTSNSVTGSHYHLAMHYRKFNKLQLALAHLDTCEIIGIKDKHIKIYMNYHRGEQACIYNDLGRTDSSKVILHRISEEIEDNLNNPQIQDHVKGYLSMIYYYLGNAYKIENNYLSAIKFYTQSLQLNQEYGLYNNIRSDVLENLAYAEFNVNRFRQSYIDLKQSKALSDTSFNISSLRNNTLIEIKSKYKDQLEQQELELLAKDKVVAEQRRSLLLIRSLLLGLLLIIFISMLFYRNHVQRRRFKLEKADMQLKRKEANEALEIKNKELTAFTLKLIDKEETIDELLKRLKEGKTEASSVESIEKSIKASSTALWDEFNTRFVEVNSGFYERLQQQYPDLSKTERKHCALIRLNFSGKEMAHLLGISVTSVHVSRYRLRKRFELEKSQNLTNFISII
ncbi:MULTISPECIES: tetratricopeptide repeat protein [unclassified Saccharicrinis]|uniref:tetratricopeptide repeat protein n=1 Tax=unclassified Saccharicrinis TaxID=2646859 RepID=UPI003D342A40